MTSIIEQTYMSKFLLQFTKKLPIGDDTAYFKIKYPIYT